MKKIVNGKDLQEKILESVHLLCGVVKETLGPKGGNVLIDHSTFSPFITNDGVTIARNIESDDETIGAVLEIVKEASIKTNDEVGDGTTTTLVLLESLYSQCLELVRKGINPIIIKKELDKELEIILKELYKIKRKPSSDDLKNIAVIASGDDELGNLAYQTLKKVKYKDAITLKDVRDNYSTISYLEGYTCSINLVSSYIFKEESVLKYKDAYILVINCILTNIENISFILNDAIKNKKSLIIISNGFSDSIINNLTSISMTEDIIISLITIEEYGLRISEIMKDICCITGAKIVSQEEIISGEDIGLSSSGQITKEDIRFDFSSDKHIKNYLEKLRKEIKLLANDIDKDFLIKRIAMFSNGLAEIRISSPTKTEGTERKMRLEDALCSVDAARLGVLPGCGVSFLKIADNINSESKINDIWKNTLREPFKQIFLNAGLNYEEYNEIIVKNEYQTIYNVSNNVWEDCNKTKVIDSYLVLEQILINATSIAGMLLTTKSLIINEYKNNTNKENEYTTW